MVGGAKKEWFVPLSSTRQRTEESRLQRSHANLDQIQLQGLDLIVQCKLRRRDQR